MKWMERLTLLGVMGMMALWASCTDVKDIPQPDGRITDPAKFISPEGVSVYYAGQLDAEAVADAPEQMYRESLAPEEVEETRTQLWELWKRANADRLAKAELSVTEAGTKPVWKIPQGEEMKVAVFAKGGRPAKGYPMIIQLHGGGSYPEVSSPWGSSINEGEWYASLGLAREYDDAPSFYWIPRMADDRKGRWYYAPQIAAFRRAFQLAALSGIIDPNRVYLTGISEGGYGALSLAMFMPDYWAAVGPMAAATQPSALIVGLRNTAFRLKVGENDSNYGRNYYAYQWEERLAELRKDNPQDFVGEVVVEKGKGHAVDYADMTPWLVGHTRRVYPERVSYVYHNIAADAEPAAGLFSPGVYYLDFRALKADTRKARLSVEVERSGSVFRIATEALEGKVGGTLGLYIDRVDFRKPVEVILNGRTVHHETVSLSRGVMAESIALFGDPERVYAAKVTVSL